MFVVVVAVAGCNKSAGKRRRRQSFNSHTFYAICNQQAAAELEFDCFSHC